MNETAVEKSILNFQNFVWFAFLLLVFSLCFVQPFVYYENLRFSPTDFIFPIASALFFISILLKKTSFRWHNFYWLLLFYFAAMLFSSVFSINPQQSFIKLLGEIYLLGLAILTFNLVKTQQHFKQVVLVWLGGMFLTLIIGILTVFLFYFQPSNPLLFYTTSIYGAFPVGNYPRLTSVFASSSMFCNFLNVSLIFLFIAEKLKYIGTKIFWILFVLLAICAFFTFSSGFGGLVLAIGVWLWAGNSDNKLIAKTALFGSIFVAILFFSINFFALQKYPNAPYSINIPLLEVELLPSSRLLVWSDSLKTFSENFFSGIGLGQNACYVSFQNTDGTAAFLTDAHNIFLSVAAQNGIFGLLAIAAISFNFVRKFSLSSLNLNSASFTKNALALAFICAFFYQGLTGSFEDTRHLWFLIGLILSAETLEKTEI